MDSIFICNWIVAHFFLLSRRVLTYYNCSRYFSFLTLKNTVIFLHTIPCHLVDRELKIVNQLLIIDNEWKYLYSIESIYSTNINSIRNNWCFIKSNIISSKEIIKKRFMFILFSSFIHQWSSCFIHYCIHSMVEWSISYRSNNSICMVL